MKEAINSIIKFCLIFEYKPKTPIPMKADITKNPDNI